MNVALTTGDIDAVENYVYIIEMHAQGAESGNAIIARLEQPSTLKLSKKSRHETTLRQFIKGVKAFRDLGGWSKDPSSWVRLRSYSGWSTGQWMSKSMGMYTPRPFDHFVGDYREKTSFVHFLLRLLDSFRPDFALDSTISFFGTGQDLPSDSRLSQNVVKLAEAVVSAARSTPHVQGGANIMS